MLTLLETFLGSPAGRTLLKSAEADGVRALTARRAALITERTQLIADRDQAMGRLAVTEAHAAQAVREAEAALAAARQSLTLAQTESLAHSMRLEQHLAAGEQELLSLMPPALVHALATLEDDDARTRRRDPAEESAWNHLLQRVEVTATSYPSITRRLRAISAARAALRALALDDLTPDVLDTRAAAILNDLPRIVVEPVA